MRPRPGVASEKSSRNRRRPRPFALQQPADLDDGATPNEKRPLSLSASGPRLGRKRPRACARRRASHLRCPCRCRYPSDYRVGSCQWERWSGGLPMSSPQCSSWAATWASGAPRRVRVTYGGVASSDASSYAASWRASSSSCATASCHADFRPEPSSRGSSQRCRSRLPRSRSFSDGPCSSPPDQVCAIGRPQPERSLRARRAGDA